MNSARNGRSERSEGLIFTLSVDTGGTFTDGYVTGGGRSAQVKVDTTPADPTEGLVACVAAAADAMDETVERFLARAKVVHFSSTIATNIAVQRRGADVGLIVTAGAEEQLYGSANDATALRALLSPDAVRGVRLTPDFAGPVGGGVNASDLDDAVRSVLELGVSIIVVSFAGAHLDPSDELAAKSLIDASYPRHYLGAIPVVLSTQISLEASDFGRTALAVANAYLHPLLARSLYRAEDRLRERKYRYPLLIVNTDGSSTRVAKTRAIDTYNSGPSAGVIGSSIVAASLGAQHVVTFDVGGTTTDVAYIAHTTPTRTFETSFATLAVPHPSIALESFGLGGGSVIEVGDRGSLSVGPLSTGAVPGPASFGLGGSELTPTDVWLYLGYLEPGEFLSGRRSLDRERAATALQRLAEKLGADPDATAHDALDAIHSHLAVMLTGWASNEAGLRAAAESDRWLFSYGGGGGLLAFAAAEALGLGRVVVFPQSSVFSAFGGGLLPVAHTYHAPVRELSSSEIVGEALAVVVDRARRDLRAEGIRNATAVHFEAVLEGFSKGSSKIAGDFDEMVSAAGLFVGTEPSRSGPGHLKVTIAASEPAVLQPPGARTPSKEVGFRTVRTREGTLEFAVVEALGIPGAANAAGPVFLAAPDTTVFVPAGWVVEFNDLGYGIAHKVDDHD